MILLGATGSIGTQAIEVITAHPERFEVVGLAAGRDVDTLGAQAAAFGVRRVAVADRAAADRLRAHAPHLEVLDGPDAATILASADAEVVLNGITGAVGLAPTLAALEAGTPVALANKESLIVGGGLVVAAAERAGGRASHLLPVDSEHSALAQCLRAGRDTEVARLVLTASGGPFRGRTREQLGDVTAADALAHPTWSMGPVITVNSATLVNKGLELLEAHLLFDVELDHLDVVVHPQSVVHSMVEFVDGSIIAQLGVTDMRLPIQYAFTYPERRTAPVPPLDLTRTARLDFEAPDMDRFPCLGLAFRALAGDAGLAIVLNAANEVAVSAFLDARIGFRAIPAVIRDAMDTYERNGASAVAGLDDVRAVDGWARDFAARGTRGVQS